MNEKPYHSPDQKRLQTLCEAMSDACVLVIGDLMLDKFVYGHVERISPESPVPVLAINKENQMLGGSGNAFANLQGLKTNPEIISVVGDDQEAQIMRNKLEASNANSAYLVTDINRPTSVKTRFLAGHQQLLRTDYEASTHINDAVKADILAYCNKLIPRMQAIILSDYGKGLLRPDLLTDIIALANQHHVPVIVDPKGQDFSIYRGADAITPNRKELADATRGQPTKSDEEIITASEAIINDCGIGRVIATRSQDGISVISKDEAPVHIRAFEDIEVFDVSGAGDTVIAVIAAALAVGASYEESAILANIAGSIAVTKVGTAPIHLDELCEALEHYDHHNGASFFTAGDKTSSSKLAPLMSTQAAQEQIKRWQAKGLKVGFTNGCFDIVHAGHVTYLAETRKHCDRLIVGLNSDSSVRILKGEERPIHDEEARAAVLRALASVDGVVLFGAKDAADDNTANGLIDLLRPCFYFKGGDYTPDQIPEVPLVRSYGGEVIILSNVEGYSTTQAITKIKASA